MALTPAEDEVERFIRGTVSHESGEVTRVRLERSGNRVILQQEEVSRSGFVLKSPRMRRTSLPEAPKQEQKFTALELKVVKLPVS